MVLVAERIISGKGLVRPGEDPQANAEARYYTVFVEVIRFPTNRFFNNAYNPPRGRYATLNFIRNDYVIASKSVDFEFQSFDIFVDNLYEGVYALSCVYDGILQTFVNLGLALNLPPISVNNNIKDYRHTFLAFDEIKVVCYADTAVKITVEASQFNLCPDQSGNTIPESPPIPPPPTPKFPVGVPLPPPSAVSEAYDGVNDNGDTVPNPIDTPDEPPLQGDECVLYRARYRIQTTNTQSPFNASDVVYGEIGDLRLAPGNNRQLQLFCRGRGLDGSNSLPCNEPGYYPTFGSGFFDITFFELVSIEPYP